MNGKIVLLALVLILAASGASVGMQIATVRIEVQPLQPANQQGSTTPRPNQTETVTGTAEATEIAATPDVLDCLPIEGTPDATLEVTPDATEEAISATFVPTPLATPDCPPFEATPDFAFTPDATPDELIATPDATEDSGRGRGRGRGRDGDDDGDDDNSGRGSGSDNSGRGSGDD